MALKCKDCAFYDEQKKFSPSGPVASFMGWCVKKSVYPHKVPDGMTIPQDAVRAEEGSDRSSPYIVVGAKVHLSCHEGVKK